MIQGVKIINAKASVASINRAGGPSGPGGCSEPRGIYGALDLLKIDLNAAEIVLFKTINAPEINVNGSTHIEC